MAAAIHTARQRGDEVAIPPVVVAQSIRGGSRDAPIHRLVHASHVPFVGLRIARRAGELLGMSGLNDAADALVMAEALRRGPAIVVTSDPDDMKLLAGGRSSVRIIAV